MLKYGKLFVVPGWMYQEQRAAAKATMLKDQRMNIRIAKRDLEFLKAKALEKGMPYQSLVSSVLHKYITGRLVESHK